MTNVDSYRPGRNHIRVGDTVRAKPPRKQSFETKVISIQADDNGIITGVEVKDPRTGNLRVLGPECISRKAQTKTTKRGGVHD